MDGLCYSSYFLYRGVGLHQKQFDSVFQQILTKEGFVMAYGHSDNFKRNNRRYIDKDNDEYCPKIYSKKSKVHNKVFDIFIPEYELDKERQRQKRTMDKLKPKNRKYAMDY